MNNYIKDTYGNTLGRYEASGNGDVRLYNTYGMQLGIYKQSENKTYDTYGNMIGSGNLLAVLLDKKYK